MSETTAQQKNTSKDLPQLAPIEVRSSSLRQTPSSNFSTILKRGLSQTSGVISRLASTAGYEIPGAAVVGAAINEASLPSDIHSDLTSFNGNSNLSGSLPGSGQENPSGSEALLSHMSERAQHGDQGAQMMLATQHMQELNQQFNLGYLQLQMSSQNDARRFTSISNVIKAKDTTARNTLSNLK
jgi:hypothetical protein